MAVITLFESPSELKELEKTPKKEGNGRGRISSAA